MGLPTKKIKMGYDLDTLRLLLYGPFGIGKTTFASMFRNALFLATEKGYKGLEVYKEDIPDWQTFLKKVSQVLNEDHNFKNIIMDTIPNLFKCCEEYTYIKYKFDHPSDVKWGKGWKLLRQEFERPLLKLTMSNLGIIFITHDTEIEISARHKKFIKTVPNLTSQAKDVIGPAVDLIGYCTTSSIKWGGVTKERRVIIFEPSEELEAKVRYGIDIPSVIPLDYEVFKSYFKNKGGDKKELAEKKKALLSKFKNKNLKR